MSKRANSVRSGKTTPSGRNLLLARTVLAGAIVAGPLFLAQAAQAQQAYYYPQAGSAQVTVNYGALAPYGAPAAPSVPGVPGGFQPYGYNAARPSAAPKSVFTPYGAPAYSTPAYSAPAYNTPAPAYYGQPVYGYTPVPATAPFVAPYANPAFAPGIGVAGGLPASTPTANNLVANNLVGGNPQSYLNVPGAQPVTLLAPGDTPVKKTKKKKKKATAATPTATEEGAAAKVAANEAALEGSPAPAAPATVAPEEAPAAVTPEAPAAPVAAAEPVAPPTPPAEPTEVPASVPSPVANAPTTSIAAAPAAGAPAADAAATEAPKVDAPAAETPAAEAPAADQVASAAAPADTAADTSGNAVLPAGGTRIVFESNADDLPQGATGELDAVAQKMLADESIKVQVLAYSSGTPDAESQARRKALARGLEIRKYLIGKGVRSNRIDVRALGTKSDGNPADRVDIVPSAG